eukprot:g9995.t1
MYLYAYPIPSLYKETSRRAPNSGTHSRTDYEFITQEQDHARFSSMASKSDLPDLTGQWLCCRQEGMDKLIEASSSGVKGWVAKNAAWATGYGVGKTTMNVDQDGNKFVIVMNGLSGERTYEFEVGVTKEIEDPRVKGMVQIELSWTQVDGTTRLQLAYEHEGNSFTDIRYINGDGELVQIQRAHGVEATRWFKRNSKK